MAKESTADEGLQACKLSIQEMLRSYSKNIAEASRRLDVAQTTTEALQVLSWLANSLLQGPQGIQGAKPTKEK
jgi:hypothetical protein